MSTDTRTDIEKAAEGSIKRGPGRPKGSSDIRPRLTNALWEGLIELSRRKQKTLSQVVADELETNFARTMNVFTKVLPREINHSGEVSSGVTIQLMTFDGQTTTLSKATPDVIDAEVTEVNELEAAKLEAKPSTRLKEMLERVKEREATRNTDKE